VTSAFLSVRPQRDTLHVGLKNRWVFENVSSLEDATASVTSADGKPVIFHCGGLQDIDIAGAWVLYDRSQQLAEEGVETDFVGFKATHFKFLQNIIDMAAIREFEEEREPEKEHRIQSGLEGIQPTGAVRRKNLRCGPGQHFHHAGNERIAGRCHGGRPLRQRVCGSTGHHEAQRGG
jgi:hypothetical protein